MKGTQIARIILLANVLIRAGSQSKNMYNIWYSDWKSINTAVPPGERDMKGRSL